MARKRSLRTTGTIVIVGALTFIPSLALGPIVEQLLLKSCGTIAMNTNKVVIKAPSGPSPLLRSTGTTLPADVTPPVAVGGPGVGGPVEPARDRRRGQARAMVRRKELADARAILDDPGKPYLVR